MINNKIKDLCEFYCLKEKVNLNVWLPTILQYIKTAVNEIYFEGIMDINYYVKIKCVPVNNDFV